MGVWLLGVFRLGRTSGWGQGAGVDPTPNLTLTLTLSLTPTRTQNRPETGEKRGCVAFALVLFIIPRYYADLNKLRSHSECLNSYLWKIHYQASSSTYCRLSCEHPRARNNSPTRKEVGRHVKQSKTCAVKAVGRVTDTKT